MRIAVIGPQSAGKTTFVQDFLKAFPHYASPATTYRNVVEDNGLEINQKTSELSQGAIRDFFIKQTKSFDAPNAIFDRCIIDNWIYSHAQYLKGDISKEFMDETEALMLEHVHAFDTILFIPTGSGLTYDDDGVRDVNRAYIDHINTLFIDLLLRLRPELPHTIITVSGSREVRIQIAANLLGLCL